MVGKRTAVIEAGVVGPGNLPPTGVRLPSAPGAVFVTYRPQASAMQRRRS